MNGSQQLLTEIAHCSIAKAIRFGDFPDSVQCHKIVSLQTGSSFQLPEPWSGRMDIAQLLFISSNPSIDELEKYPDQSWESHLTTDFFHNRFTSATGWVKNGLYPLLQNDTYRQKHVRFWACTRARACEILQKGKNLIVPGIDFALTEVVHCKSRNEMGVKESQDFCSQRYLERVLSVSVAKVLIVYGKPAKDALHRRLGHLMTPQPQGLSLASIGDSPRMLVFLPHPNERGSKKSLKDNVGDDGLSLIRAHLEAK
jgi:hypothetical protein